MLSTGYTKDHSADDLAQMDAGSMARSLKASVWTMTKVNEIDTAAQLIKVGDAQTAIHYGKLVLAVGAEVIRPPIEGDALEINSQSLNPDPERGNLNLKGGGWEDGHLRLENGHLWVDMTNNVVRYKNGAPTSETDGAPLYLPPGTNAAWGGAYWGDSGSADYDTGDEVCALAGLSCKETYDMGSATPLACSSSSHATPSYLALCY